MKEAVPQLAIDFINGLMHQYIKLDYSKKLASLEQSLEFLKNQIENTQDKLNQKELISQKLKDDTKIYDLDAAADDAYSQVLALQEEKEHYALQKNYYDLVIGYIENHRNFSDLVAPSLMGIDDPMVASIVENLKEVYVEKAQKEFSVTTSNPTYTTLGLGQQKTIDIALENLDQGQKRIDFSIKSIDKQMEEKYTLLKSLPSAELNFLRVKREIDGLNKLLEFLVEKKASLGISASKITSNHEVVDSALLLSDFPVSPKYGLTKLVFLVLGLILIGIIIYFLCFHNEKIEFASQVESLTNLPLLGVLNEIKKYDEIVAFNHPRSLFCENLRALKHQLSFLNNKQKGETKVIGITSFLSGEGKTFVASNFSALLTLGDKKAILIGADLRKPKLKDYFPDLVEKGLSEYLSGSSQLNEVITNVNGLDVIGSGELPPNPSELLESGAFQELINQLKVTYDFVIIDCSPIGLVSDYRSVSKVMDVTLFIVKQGYSSMRNLKAVDKLSLSNTFAVFNGEKKSRINKYGYGYGYGQEYYQEK